MKNAKAGHGQEKAKRNAEEWVVIARNFGEQCIAIQHDSKLNPEEKLEKQKTLSKEMTKEIQVDVNLKDEDRQHMLESIKSYMDEWEKMHHMLQNPPDKKNEKKKK